MSAAVIPAPTLIGFTCAMVELGEKWKDAEDPQVETLAIEDVSITLMYKPISKIVRASVVGQDVDIAVHADCVRRSMVLIGRELWKCKKRKGVICVSDDSSAEPQLVRIREFELLCPSVKVKQQQQQQQEIKEIKLY